MISIFDAILAINPNARVNVENNSVDNITWDQGQTVISKKDIEAKKAQLETEYNANSYQRKRVLEYKELKEQLDLLYHDMTAGKLNHTGKWHMHIKSVKDKYPKG